MTDVVVRCSNCGAQIAKRDCRCKGDGKLVSGWTLDDVVVKPAAPPEPEAANA